MGDDKISQVAELHHKYPVEFAEMIEKPIHSNGNTMLMRAAKYGSGQVAKYLISNMKDINQQSNSGYNALILAAYNNKFEIVKMLVATGCDITLKDKSSRTALYYAKECGNTAIVEYLENTQQQVR